MKFLKKLLVKWIKEAQEEEYSNKSVGLVAVRDEARVDDEPILNFRIYSANNGRIIEFSKYDRLKDKNHRSVYVCQPDDDIGEKISKYVNLELLR